MRRTALMTLLPAAAMALLPASPARAAGSVAVCFHSWWDSASPGIGTTAGRSTFTSGGERWTLTCQGTVRGNKITGPGLFGEYGYIDGDCGTGGGEVTFDFWVPTTAGEERFHIVFNFVYGPGGGTAKTQDFPGVFQFVPKAGDCVNAPVTEFTILRSGVLLS